MFGFVFSSESQGEVTKNGQSRRQQSRRHQSRRRQNQRSSIASGTTTSETNHVLDTPGSVTSPGEAETAMPVPADLAAFSPSSCTLESSAAPMLAVARPHIAKQLNQQKGLKRSKSVAPPRRPFRKSFNLHLDSSDEDAENRKTAMGKAVQKNWDIEELFEFDIDRLVGLARSKAWGIVGDLSKGGHSTATEAHSSTAEGDKDDEQMPGVSELEELRQECALKSRQIQRLRRVVCELLMWGQSLQTSLPMLDFDAGTPTVKKMRSEAPEFVPLGISWALPEPQPVGQTSDLACQQKLQPPLSAEISALLKSQPGPGSDTALCFQHSAAAAISQGQIASSLDHSLQPARMPQASRQPQPTERITGLIGRQNVQPVPMPARSSNLLITQPSPRTTVSFQHESSSQAQILTTLGNCVQPASMQQSLLYSGSTIVHRPAARGALAAWADNHLGTTPYTDAPAYEMQSSVGLLGSGAARSQQQNHTNASVGSNVSPLVSGEAPVKVVGKGRGRRGKSRRARRAQSMMPMTESAWRGQETGQLV